MASLEGMGNERYDLIKDVVTIGRDSTSDIVVGTDPRVSRAHAELRLTDGNWFVVDLDSRNGTEVNGRLVSRHPLRDGDLLRVGSTALTYVAGIDANATEIGTASGEVIVPDLSERERQILMCVAQGLTDRDIGDQLHISISTVRSHLDRMRDKTGLRRRSELTRLAIELKIDE